MSLATATQWLAQIDVLKASLGAGGLLVALVMVAWIGRRLRKPAIVSLGSLEGPRGLCARLWARVGRLLDAIDYLATRREWRYRQPWVLVLGEQGAGKSSLIESVSETWRHRAPANAAELKAIGMRWSYFRHGVLIDSEGKLAAAAEGSEEAALWKKSLDELCALRPERPLDGIVLCVSAHTLRTAKHAQRVALAENVNQQICQLQASVEFMLPVYVVVTQCDDIPGFAAFWQSQGKARREELIGYSAVAQDQDAQPSAWAATAFDLIGARLREIQVDVAALRERIDDVDEFFLFPGHFGNLREPLAQWLETVFRATAWQSGYLFRGMYFIGSVEAAGTRSEDVRRDVSFVDALVAEKVLREPALARLTRQGIWSRNRLIRGVQIAAVTAALGLFVALGLAAQQVARQVDATVKGIASLQQVAPRVPDAGSGDCLAREDVYPLLARVSRINTSSRYLLIPLSWLDGRLTSRSAAFIRRSTVQRVLMPTISCLLEERSRELLASSSNPVPASASGLARQRAEFHQLLVDARALEDNFLRFETLAERSESLDERGLIETLDRLAQYAFGEPLPREVWRPGGVLDDAFDDIMDVPQPVLPNGLHYRLAASIEVRSKSLRAALGREVSLGDDLLGALNDGEPPVLHNTRRMGAWLAWVQQSWLGSTAERNPCREIVNANKNDIDALIAYYGTAAGLSGVLTRFGTTQCHQPELRELAAMRMAPYGPLFVSGNGGLMLAPALQSELVGMPALVALPFMQLTSVRPFECVGGAAMWRANEIAEAAGYLNEYEAFARQQKLPQLPAGGRPLYARLARQSLAHALDDALRRAQKVPPNAPRQEDSLEAASRTDAQLAQVSSELAKGLSSLHAVLHAYADDSFSDGGAQVRQCARNFAADSLGTVDALADSSRLYAPPTVVGNDAMFALGSLPVIKDFLSRQVARAQVLTGHANPFVSVLSDTPGVDDAWRDNPQTAEYWRNTLVEINRYVQAKEPTGQVANLDAYFIGQLADMSYASCAKTLASYKAPEYGNDLFSERRRTLERQVQLRCTDQLQAQADEVYSALATRFNRDLAGRYPFGELGARDAGLAVVRSFFRDYAAQRESIFAALNNMEDDQWQAASSFVQELDEVAEFFATNVSAPEQMDAVALTAAFPAEAAKSVGGDQLLSWRLAVGDTQSVFPNGLKALEWLPGEPLVLDLQWAERSDWRPVADPAQADLSTQDAVASFSSSGPWALLRFIDMHRVRSASTKDPEQILLGFVVPVQGVAAGTGGKAARSEAKVFMTWRLSGVDAKTQAKTKIALPADFPSSAPTE